MQSNEIRTRFLKFFEKRGHAIIPSASLVPENDPSVLFNTAGMQPLVPYLLGEKHPAGNRIVDVQKCVRTTDIDEVGDNTHLTFFEMLGNWSLGDYFKEDAIKWSYEFLTNKEEGLGLDPSRLYVTVFEGDENAPRDIDAFNIWKNFVPENRIYFMSAKSNWWSPGDNGPCGPDTEMFYDVTREGLGDLNKEGFIKADEDQKVIEIWNDVFMEYEKRDGKVIGKLSQHNVDTGAGLERLAIMMQGKDSVFEIDGFEALINQVKQVASGEKNQKIIADHFRTSVFLISDGILPDNHDRGYVLRRILRRAILKTNNKEINAGNISTIVDSIVDYYGGFYGSLIEKRAEIKKIIEEESNKFNKTLSQGLKQFEKISGDISGKDAFTLSATYGFPIEITQEIAEEKGIKVDVKAYEEEMQKHQELSRTSSVGKFKGGLGGHDENSTKLHTTTHLLNQALKEILGGHIEQKGSNITPERLRFDFSHPEKMTDEQKQKVEELVNQKIKENLDVEMEEMPVEEARERGATGVFGDKYGEKVKVYSIGDFSKEICGGPHVENTKELGNFKILKEEACSAGVRRIKAVLG